MPRPNKGARLWLRPATRDAQGKIVDHARWLIKDGGRQIGTGCSAGEREEAERKLADYIASKYEPERRERSLSEIRIADVIAIYLKDVAPGHARPEKAGERAERLLEFFGDKRLDEINGSLCRAYVKHREGKGRTNRGKGGGAKRDLEDLRAAIGHHHAEGLHRAVVRVVLPERGEPRKRWLPRGEFARLLWTCWRTPEIQRGKPTDKRPLRHLCRFLLLGVYTGSRPGAVLNATWDRGPGRSWVDVDRGIFHRQPEAKAETNKRQPTVRLHPRLAAHMRRWKQKDGGAGYVVRFDGGPVASVKTALASASKAAGLNESVTGYAMRHTCATWLISKGVPVWDVAQFLGTSVQMIEKHYGHHAPDFQDRALAALARK